MQIVAPLFPEYLLYDYDIYVSSAGIPSPTHYIFSRVIFVAIWWEFVEKLKNSTGIITTNFLWMRWWWVKHAGAMISCVCENRRYTDSKHNIIYTSEVPASLKYGCKLHVALYEYGCWTFTGLFLTHILDHKHPQFCDQEPVVLGNFSCRETLPPTALRLHTKSCVITGSSAGHSWRHVDILLRTSASIQPICPLCCMLSNTRFMGLYASFLRDGALITSAFQPFIQIWRYL